MSLRDNDFGPTLEGNDIKADGARVLADMLKTNRIGSLDISGNGLHFEGFEALVQGLDGNTVTTELNLADNRLSENANQFHEALAHRKNQLGKAGGQATEADGIAEVPRRRGGRD